MKDVDNKKIIGFDLDGVIINHAPTKIKLAKKFGFNIKPQETYPEVIKNIFDRQSYIKFQEDLYYNPKIFKKTPLMSGAKSGLSTLKRSRLPFVLISRRRNPEATIVILKHYKLWPNFFNEKNTFFVSRPEDKNIKAREIGITHYADDEIDVLKKLADIKNKFFFDNSCAFKNIRGYTRVKSWRELMGHLLK